MDHTETTPNPALQSLVLDSLHRAGRPVTRGELVQMFMPRKQGRTVANVQVALDALTAAGKVAVGTERDERLHRCYTTYRLSRDGGGPMP